MNFSANEVAPENAIAKLGEPKAVCQTLFVKMLLAVQELPFALV